MNNNQDNMFGNWIDIIALIIGLINLQENRQQSAYNDVQSANDKQAEYLLSEINRRFDEQNQMLRKLLEAIGGNEMKTINANELAKIVTEVIQAESGEILKNIQNKDWDALRDEFYYAFCNAAEG